ncbi:hypothetical protein MFLAVUS_001356 [Mucor flavus]|uniref:BTB domain-containing protein n=1 Tax=Mucor flavus TaxID=439312 RepID=A0ABP9YM84_9FUNG
MEDATINGRESTRRSQASTVQAMGLFTRGLENSLLPLPAPDRHRSRSTPKVTDHPWLTIDTPYSEFGGPIQPKLYSSNSSNNNSSQFNNNSNHGSNTHNGNSSKYDWRKHSLMICRHILRRGLSEGIGSDIKIYVPTWEKTYNLHRLILDQNPYFKLLLQGSFQEAESNIVTLHFDDNPYITIESFQFVLEYLYGKIDDPLITQANVRQILATSSYFQLDVCGICVDYILKNLNHKNVVTHLIFADGLMVQGSERICDAIFTFICREAYGMDRDILVSLPLNWLQKVIESDAFWVPSEYERYHFIKQIIQARHEAYIISPSTFVLTDLDTNPDCHILSRSIHYMHMTFEQLESIQNDTHPLTRQRLISEKVLREALWLQVKLRSKIESASESDIKLNMTISTLPNRPSDSETTVTAETADANEEEEEYDDCYEECEEEPVEKKSLLGKYYLIPKDDTTTYTSESTGSSSVDKKKCSHQKSLMEEYSIYPPFRFSVEFADVSALKYSMRVCSDTIFYAGSNWNMYIQKTRSQRKGILQLGVYLHRQSVPHQQQQQQQQHQSHHTCQHSDDPQSRASSGTDFKVPTPNSTNENWSFSRYSDKRKVVKTWFKIYCPSRGPKHALTLFQSSPDNFSVLQSWGWRSTTLCADEDENATTASSDSSSTPEKTENSPPPLLYTPQTSNQLHYLQSTYDLRTIKSALNNVQQQKSSTSSGPSLRFTVVMGHV